MYCRFVDDSFAHVDHRQDFERLLDILNSLHPALQFTCELENDGRLPYLDVLIEKSKNDGILTSIYRKPTFTGLYITWDSFCATKYKVNLVRNLVQRAHRICSDSKLDEELSTLKSVFSKNGYPLDLLSRLVQRKSEINLPEGPKRCPVYLKLPWKGPWSSLIARNIHSVVQSTYYSVNVNCVFTTSRAFNLRKDVLPSNQLSNLIYEFECRNCKSRYVGRTAQRLSSRIRQHACSFTSACRRRTCRETNPRETPIGSQRGELGNGSNVRYNRLCGGRNDSGSGIWDDSNGSSYNSSTTSSSGTTTIGKRSGSGNGSCGVSNNNMYSGCSVSQHFGPY